MPLTMPLNASLLCASVALRLKSVLIFLSASAANLYLPHYPLLSLSYCLTINPSHDLIINLSLPYWLTTNPFDCLTAWPPHYLPL